MVVVATMTDDDACRRFGLEVRRLRQAQDLTLEQLAERAGVSQNYIGTIENGHRDPSLSTIEALAIGLGVATGELFGPVAALSELGLDMAKLFDQLPRELQAAILQILRSAPRGPLK
jgi:transcriptional regulator with XRE-family HTH domain